MLKFSIKGVTHMFCESDLEKMVIETISKNDFPEMKKGLLPTAFCSLATALFLANININTFLGCAESCNAYQYTP